MGRMAACSTTSAAVAVRPPSRASKNSAGCALRCAPPLLSVSPAYRFIITLVLAAHPTDTPHVPSVQQSKGCCTSPVSNLAHPCLLMSASLTTVRYGGGCRTSSKHTRTAAGVGLTTLRRRHGRAQPLTRAVLADQGAFTLPCPTPPHSLHSTLPHLDRDALILHAGWLYRHGGSALTGVYGDVGGVPQS
jgi:hypothetical protein